MSAPAARYRYLRIEGGWPRVELDGLEFGPGGEIALRAVPREVPAGLAGPETRWGVAADAQGHLYLSAPESDQVLRVDACTGAAAPLASFGGTGDAPGRLRGPRGLALEAGGRLWVADRGNHRVQCVDTATGAIVAILSVDPDEDGENPMAHPLGVTLDGRGRVYVAFSGVPGTVRAGVRRFGAGGAPDVAFDDVLAAQKTRPREPGGVAIVALGAEERLLVLDVRGVRILVFDLTGRLDARATQRWARSAAALGAAPTALFVAGGLVRVAEASSRAVRTFDAEGRLLGTGPLVHPGGGRIPPPAAPGRVARGSLLAGPFRTPAASTRWQRLRAETELAEGAHVRWFTVVSDTWDGTAGRTPSRPPDAPCDAHDPERRHGPEELAVTALDCWRAAPWDASDLRLRSVPGRWLWIAAVLEGDGAGTPVLRQVRLDFDHDGWSRHLPALYRRDDAGRAFLDDLLAVFESETETCAERIEALPRLFDPWAAPDGEGADAWLDWLAERVDASLDERWDDRTRRGAVAAAFRQHARRGTLEHLRALVALHAGADATIEDAALGPSLWVLGESSALGDDTALAPAEPDGAVLGTTAEAGRSHLVPSADFGAPAYDERAHRVTVTVRRGELRGDGAEQRLRALLARETPAHVELCVHVVEPGVRVGLQARVGIDAVVGGPGGPTALDEPGPPGGGLITLAGRPASGAVVGNRVQ